MRSFFRKFGVIIGYIFLFVVCSGVVAWLSVSLLRIQAIEIIGDNISLAVDQQKLPKSLLFFPSDKIREQILSEHPLLSDITFRKKFPGTLVIVSTLRKPYVHLSTQTRSVSLDETGVVLGDADMRTPLPRIELASVEIRVGKISEDARVTASLQFIEATKDMLPIEKITEVSGGSLQAKATELDIIFPQNKPMSEILATLQTLLSGFRIKGTLPAFVDLRFDKPIIRF